MATRSVRTEYFVRATRDLRQQSRHDLSMHVGQAVLTALVAECEASVIDAAEVQHGGLHVMHVHRVFGITRNSWSKYLIPWACLGKNPLLLMGRN